MLTPYQSISTDVLDDQFGLLANEYRRSVLMALRSTNGQIEPLSVTEINSDRRDRPDLPVELYHVHLPKLERAGYVRWNRETNALSRGPQFDEIRPLLDVLDAYTRGVRADGTSPIES